MYTEVDSEANFVSERSCNDIKLQNISNLEGFDRSICIYREQNFVLIKNVHFYHVSMVKLHENQFFVPPGKFSQIPKSFL